MQEVEKLKQKIARVEETQVPTSSLRPNKWNFNVQNERRFRSLKATLDRFGRIYPIIVRAIEDGKYEIIDGEHRWKALRQLRVKLTPVKNLGKVSDIVAKELMAILNKTRGEANLERLGVSLARIVRTMEEEGENPLELLPYDESQFKRLMASTENFEPPEEGAIDDKEWDDVRKSTRLCTSHKFRKVKMRRCKKCGTLED